MRRSVRVKQIRSQAAIPSYQKEFPHRGQGIDDRLGTRCRNTQPMRANSIAGTTNVDLCPPNSASMPSSRLCSVSSSRMISRTIRALKLATAVTLPWPLPNCARRIIPVSRRSYMTPCGMGPTGATAMWNSLSDATDTRSFLCSLRSVRRHFHLGQLLRRFSHRFCVVAAGPGLVAGEL
jgi:hypothetical protein